MTKISDERLAEMLAYTPTHADNKADRVFYRELRLIIRELQQLRAHNSDSAEPVACVEKPKSLADAILSLAKDGGGTRDLSFNAGLLAALKAAEPLYLASPPAKEVIDDGRWKRIYDALAKEGGGTWATYMMIDIEALTNRTPDDEVGNE